MKYFNAFKSIFLFLYISFLLAACQSIDGSGVVNTPGKGSSAPVNKLHNNRVRFAVLDRSEVKYFRAPKTCSKRVCFEEVKYKEEENLIELDKDKEDGIAFSLSNVHDQDNCFRIVMFESEEEFNNYGDERGKILRDPADDVWKLSGCRRKGGKRCPKKVDRDDDKLNNPFIDIDEEGRYYRRYLDNEKFKMSKFFWFADDSDYPPSRGSQIGDAMLYYSIETKARNSRGACRTYRNVGFRDFDKISKALEPDAISGDPRIRLRKVHQ